MGHTRRQHLTWLGTSIAGASIASSLSAGDALGAAKAKAKRGTIIGPGFYIEDDTKKKSFVVGLVDLDAKKLARREIAIDFFGHGVSPNPVAPHKAAIFEKKGPGACEVDLVAGKMLRRIPTTPDRHFYGHGAWAADGSVVFVVESVITDKYRGVITIRDGKTFEVRGEFPTYGAAPHDCLLIDGGKVLAITNGGGPIDGGAVPSVTYVDVASQKLLEEVVFSTPRINAGHIAITSKGDLAVVSAPRDGLGDLSKVPGGVSLRAKGQKVQTMAEPADVVARMLGETLSVAVHEPTSIVAATNPEGHVVTFWDLKTSKLVKKLELPYPRGVTLTLDQKAFVVSYSPASTLVLVDTKTLEPIPGSTFEPSYMSGSHVIAYAMP
ncbi:DUF1513 domain-containing protein [Myxococcota bacterium]|nr:DUF1513 domain-containing protein [Myxococcota bacterium]